MNGLSIGQDIFIESFKHDGSLHRVWSKGIVIDTNPDFTVAVTDHTWIVESDGRRWLTKEPAVCFFYDHHWFNVISMIRKAGIYYYCNLASPSLYDGEAIKNIDYDLDVKVYPDGTYHILDENEYALHSREMNYSQELKKKVESEMEILIGWIREGKEPFSFSYINNYLMQYFQIAEDLKK
jgi:protein associated with RNAse G/E